jgi:hypothetical protein
MPSVAETSNLTKHIQVLRQQLSDFVSRRSSEVTLVQSYKRITKLSCFAPRQTRLTRSSVSSSPNQPDDCTVTEY